MPHATHTLLGNQLLAHRQCGLYNVSSTHMHTCRCLYRATTPVHSMSQSQNHDQGTLLARPESTNTEPWWPIVTGSLPTCLFAQPSWCCWHCCHPGWSPSRSATLPCSKHRRTSPCRMQVGHPRGRPPPPAPLSQPPQDRVVLC